MIQVIPFNLIKDKNKRYKKSQKKNYFIKIILKNKENKNLFN